MIAPQAVVRWSDPKGCRCCGGRWVVYKDENGTTRQELKMMDGLFKRFIQAISLIIMAIPLIGFELFCLGIRKGQAVLQWMVQCS